MWGRPAFAVACPGGRLESLPHNIERIHNVFNPAVIHHNGLFHMFYRAQRLDWISRIGYAVGQDGVRWNHPRQPVLEPVGGADLPMIARSENLIAWERLEPIARGEDNKDHVLFPRRIGGRYATLHRRRPHVWLAYALAPILHRHGDFLLSTIQSRHKLVETG